MRTAKIGPDLRLKPKESTEINWVNKNLGRALYPWSRNTIDLFHNGGHYLFILSYVYKWAFLDLFESKNSLVFCTCQLGEKKYIKKNILVGQTGSHLQWNLSLADTFGTFPSLRLIGVVKIAQCLFTISIRQRLLCTVIKLHVVTKEAIQSSNSLPFITNFNLFVNAKTLTDFSTYFKDVIQYYYCQFSPMPERFLTIEISQIQLILVSASA